MSAMAGMIAVGESAPPIKNPMAVRTKPPTKNCQPGEQDAVMLAREDTDEAGRQGARNRGSQDKALAIEREAKGAICARKVDKRDAGQSPTRSQAPWPY